MSDDLIRDFVDQLGTALVNDPKTDLFALARLTTRQMPRGESAEMDSLRNSLPARFYASFVPIGQGMIYFVWTRQEGEWRIHHASLACM